MMRWESSSRPISFLLLGCKDVRVKHRITGVVHNDARTKINVSVCLPLPVFSALQTCGQHKCSLWFQTRGEFKNPNYFQRCWLNSSVLAYCALVLHQTERSLNVLRNVYGFNDSIIQKSGLFTGKVPSDLLYLWFLPPKRSAVLYICSVALI